MLGFEDFKKLRREDFDSLAMEGRIDLQRLSDAKPEQYANLEAGFLEAFEEWKLEKLYETAEGFEAALVDFGDLGSKNPLHAWAAWKTTRKQGLRVPDWVLRYFDHTADSILSLVDEKPDDPTKQ